MDKYLINLNSVDYTELPATSKRALFPHASSLIFMMTQKRHHPALASRQLVDLYDDSKTTPSRPCLTRARVLPSKRTKFVLLIQINILPSRKMMEISIILTINILPHSRLFYPPARAGG
ncbi:hypothetical protein CSK47_13900 [Salmonella enterica]|nr:hypothetical protein [Salmonella enterica]EIB3852036.1 hypothetical protein [Salmonella enterica]